MRAWQIGLALGPTILLACQGTAEEPAPLKKAHAHNDYEHKRPLLDALDQGFCSVEADIWLIKGELLVAHTPFELKSERTLQKLYLHPLRERIKANNGKVHATAPAFYLLIDVKSEAKQTYAELSKVLEGYAELLTVTRDGKTETKAITVVITGNCDRDGITKQAVRYAAIDGRPADLDADLSANLVPWVSASWGSQFKWNGTGPMPDAERTKLKEFVARAHRHGRLVRFWATPEKPEVWRELLAADVDLINTDKLEELRTFLLKDEKR
jgi:hypothetical protein